MRKAITILSIIALVCVAFTYALSLFAIRRIELERNRERTENARAKRWERKPPVNGVVQMEEPKIEITADEKN